jgi:hypothetical protein
MKVLAVFGVVTWGVLSASLAKAQDLEPTALTAYADLPDGINTAIVIDQQGRTLGIVAKVELRGDGRPKQVDVLMPGGRHLLIQAPAASYDFEANRVIANFSVTQTADTAHDPRG